MKRYISLIVTVLLLMPQGAAALCVQGDCLNGQGTVVLPDGRRYVGEFKDGVRTGRGLMTFPDGTKYLGDWQDDKPHGQGTLSSVGKFEYAGEFANGVREGQGTLETVDGKKYSGQWLDDVPHGQGRIVYPDGGTFVGQFENGRRNGQGEADYPDGTKYTGNWKDDLPNGAGTKIFSDGEKYTGEFRNGLMHGIGTVVKPDGSSFTGQWQNDVLVKKEEVVAEPEFSTVDETEGHVIAVVDEKPAAVSQPEKASEAVAEPTPSSQAVIIAQTAEGYASVNQNGVFVRSGPSTEYRVVRSVYRGFPVQVIGQEGNWSNVKDFVGQEGWIYSPLLGSNNSVIVNASKVNLRSGPGVDFSVASQVDFGTVLQVNTITSEWYSVSTTGGITGWLSREFIWPTGHAVVPSRTIADAEPLVAEAVVDAEQASTPDVYVESKEFSAAGIDRPVVIPAGEPETPEAMVVAVAVETPETPQHESTEVQGYPNVAVRDDKEYAGIALNGKGANIRSQPSLAAEVLRAVPPGYPLAVIERQGDWALVEDFRERKGWVYDVLLTELQTVVIKVGKGNLRTGQSLTDEIIAKLDYGVVMFVDEFRGDWLKVSNTEGLAGWLHRDVVWP